MLQTSGLSKSFEGFYAVEDVDFEIERGELHGLIGPNGAGKTTLFNLLTGDLEPTGGTIRFKGEDITDLEPTQITRRGIGRSFQIVRNFPEMTVREHLTLPLMDETRSIFTMFDDRDYSEEIERVAADVQLDDQLDTIAENLSHGDERFLELGMVLALDPELILLDEPAAGLNETESQILIDLLEEIRDQYTILLVDHDIDLVRDLSDRITVLHQGGILAQGTADVISENDRVQEVYLGE